MIYLNKIYDIFEYNLWYIRMKFIICKVYTFFCCSFVHTVANGCSSGKLIISNTSLTIVIFKFIITLHNVYNTYFIYLSTILALSMFIAIVYYHVKTVLIIIISIYICIVNQLHEPYENYAKSMETVKRSMRYFLTILVISGWPHPSSK